MGFSLLGGPVPATTESSGGNDEESKKRELRAARFAAMAAIKGTTTSSDTKEANKGWSISADTVVEQEKLPVEEDSPDKHENT